MSKKSLFDSDDDSGGIDQSGYAWSVGHGVIDFDTGSFARGGKPGGSGGGGGGGTPPPPTSTYISGNSTVDDSAEYNVKIVFQGTWSDSLKQAFTDSANEISKFIKGDVLDYVLNGQYIDDITITASLVPIDGAGGILGQAGPEYVRSPSYLPLTATMQFDVDDASYYQGIGLFDDIVLHEMMHSVGFGSVWSYKHLVSAGKFTGTQAVTAYHTEVPGSTGGVPVEQTGGPGTAGSHWSEAVFTKELMTGYINSNNDLSYMSVASLGDLGYSIIDFGHYTAPGFI